MSDLRKFLGALMPHFKFLVFRDSAFKLLPLPLPQPQLQPQASMLLCARPKQDLPVTNRVVRKTFTFGISKLLLLHLHFRDATQAPGSTRKAADAEPQPQPQPWHQPANNSCNTNRPGDVDEQKRFTLKVATMAQSYPLLL